MSARLFLFVVFIANFNGVACTPSENTESMENQNGVDMEGSEVLPDVDEVPVESYDEEPKQTGNTETEDSETPVDLQEVGESSDQSFEDPIESGENMQTEELSEPEALGESYEDESTETPYRLESLAEDDDDFIEVGGTHYQVALFVFAILMVVPALYMVMQVPVLQRTGLLAPFLNGGQDV